MSSIFIFVKLDLKFFNSKFNIMKNNKMSLKGLQVKCFLTSIDPEIADVIKGGRFDTNGVCPPYTAPVWRCGPC